MRYISTQSIKEAYNQLVSQNYSNASILHIFFILKGIGLNSLTYSQLDDIKNYGMPYAFSISSLFSPFEIGPEKCDFINPFSMDTWSGNPTEQLKKWVGGRVKNNVIGGATTWRAFIMQNTSDDFKFTYNYVDEIASITTEDTNLIPLQSLAIWANRFTEFEKDVTITQLVDDFIKCFHLTNEEIQRFFKSDININLTFDNVLHSTREIRELIGTPSGLSTWVDAKMQKTEININNSYLRRYDYMSEKSYSKATLAYVLTNYCQAILSGPPGTSKSYLVSELGKEYDKTVHVQFHPQYTYQQFIGGYVVEGTNVKFSKGVFLNLIEEAKTNSTKKYLLVIDEINRANASQVFGEAIQALDRNASVDVLVDGKLETISIPKNLHIVGTMNTTDKTIGSLDYALKRRFMSVYCESNPSLLLDLCVSKGDFISVSDLLRKINANLFTVLKNKEFAVGHAIFLEDSVKNSDNKYEWDFSSFEYLFNFKVLPIIEDYCNNTKDQIENVVGAELSQRLSGEEFKKALINFTK